MRTTASGDVVELESVGFDSLRIGVASGARATDLARFLLDLQDAYVKILAFERAITRGVAHVRRLGRSDFDLPELNIPTRNQDPELWVRGLETALREAERGILGSAPPLVLHRASISSPGFLEFIGALNPLEVLRKFLHDRHERRKDTDYRENAESLRLELENDLLAEEVIEKSIDNALKAGATKDDLAPHIEMLLKLPLHKLAQHQDSGLISDVHVVDQNGNELTGPRPPRQDPDPTEGEKLTRRTAALKRRRRRRWETVVPEEGEEPDSPETGGSGGDKPESS